MTGKGIGRPVPTALNTPERRRHRTEPSDSRIHLATPPRDNRTMDDGIFDSSVAPHYDADSAAMFDPALLRSTVDVLVDLADGRSVLEFAIGTGRVALPLRERGVDVAGIELSRAMVAELRAKPGGDAIPIVIGDMASARFGGDYGLVYLVYNTIENLLTQDAQVDCFRNAAAHLGPGGRFVVEVVVPRPPVGTTIVACDVSDDHVGVDAYDVVTQRLTSHHAFGRDGAGRRFDSEHRYVWPAELDLMARLAGLSLEHRWADWDRSEFTAESRSHVSVWRAATVDRTALLT